MIRNARSEKICYIGSSATQLKKTIYRHFQQWNDRQRNNRSFERKTYPKLGYEIRFIKCNADKALRLEMYLINKHQPKDNPLKYENMNRKQLKEGRVLENEFHNSSITLSKDQYWIGMEETPF